MTLLLIDLNNVLFRNLYINQNLRYKSKRTGAFYGFVQTFAKNIVTHKPRFVIVCKDSRPYIRTKLCEEIGIKYKGDRPKLEESFLSYIQESKKYVNHFLNLMNIPIVGFEGYEADDVIASFSFFFNQIFNQIVILSNDSDLYQLLNIQNLYIQKKDVLYSEKHLQDEWNVSPYEYQYCQIAAGNHNGIPPIEKGIGMKTAIKLWRKDLLYDKYENSNSSFLQTIFQKRQVIINLPINFDFHDTLHTKGFCTERKTFKERVLVNSLYGDFGFELTDSIEEMIRILNI